jgi:cysteinyl-tRNA synthetase
MTKKINFFNTLRNTKEDFVPINPNKVSMYVCGPTVYDSPHIGNARPLVVFDILYRLLREIYGESNIVYVRNITDIDDKIIESSRVKKINIETLTKEITSSFHKDCEYLNCLKPNFEPKATNHIKEMISMISVLIKNKNAYESDKHVYFSVSSFKNYGNLSNKNLEQLVAGSRVEVSKSKKNPLDFVLWKPSSNDEPSWDSPWGNGRPGWHLECSVMSEKYLGKNFDIHAGGIDLIFPHHENEIAQSCCANKTDNFANYWMHNGFVTLDKEKMSKSKGKIVTINKIKESTNGQVVRLSLLSSHYKQPLDWNMKLVEESKKILNKWYTMFDEELEDEVLESLITQKEKEDVLSPLMEDLNTPEYISKLHALFEKATTGTQTAKIQFMYGCKAIGLFNEDKKTWEDFKKSKVIVDENYINKKIIDRKNARNNNNFKLADDIRNELEKNGVKIEDTESKTTWKYK